MQKAYHTPLSEVQKLAKKLGAELKGGEILALVGPLGSGKTTFTQALAKTLHVKSSVTSPTFVIMNRYQGLVGSAKKHKIFFYHLDLYRTNTLKEVKALGLTELWERPDSVVVIEWADKIKSLLPKKTIVITFTHN